MRKSQRNLAHFVGGGLRLRSAKQEHLKAVSTQLFTKDVRYFYTFSFMLHEVDREQVIFYNLGTDGGWDQGYIVSVDTDNRLKVRAKSVYIGSQSMDGNEAYAQNPDGFYEKLTQGGTMFKGTDVLVTGKVYTIALWQQGQYRAFNPRTYKGISYSEDPASPYYHQLSDYPYNGHEIWLNGVYQGNCGPTPVTLGGTQPIGFGRHPTTATKFADMTLFHFDGFVTQNGDNSLDVKEFFKGPNLGNSGRGNDMRGIHKFLGKTRTFSFDFRSDNLTPLISTISSHQLEFQPRYSIQAKNDALRQNQDRRVDGSVVLSSSATPSTDSPYLRDHIFEGGNQYIVGVGLTGDLDSFDNRNALPNDYSADLNVSSNQMSGTSVINSSKLTTFNMDTQTGPGNNDISWNGQTPQLIIFSANNAKLSSMVFQPGTRVGNLYLGSNPALTTFNMDNLSAGVPGTVYLDNCTSLATVTMPQVPLTGATGFLFSAPNTALTTLDVSIMVSGWRNYNLTNTTSLASVVFPPTGHQVVSSFIASNIPMYGNLDFSSLPGLETVNINGAPNLTGITFTTGSTNNQNYAIQNVGVNTLDFTPVTKMGYSFAVASCQFLNYIYYPQANRGMSDVTVANNAALTGVQDLRWVSGGTNQLFIGGCPNVTQWILPDTVDNASAAPIGNMIGAIFTQTPGVLDFSRTKISNQMLISQSNMTEFRYSAASIGNGAWTLGRFELSSCPNLTRFDLDIYPSTTFDQFQLQFNPQMSVVTFPTGRNIQFYIFNIRGCASLNIMVPFGNGVTIKAGGSTAIDSCPMSVANIRATIDSLYQYRTAHDNTGLKSLGMDTTQLANLTGVRQAPSGYVQGSTDGTPATQKEMIYVLENQTVSAGGAKKYNWVITPAG